MQKEKLGKIGKFLAHSKGAVCCTSLNQDGQLLATGGVDQKIHLWSTDRASCILSLTAHNSSVEAVRFNHDSCKLASGSRAGSVKVWDMQNIKEVRELSGHKAAITCLDFLPLGDFVGSAAQDSKIKIWDVRRRGCIRTFAGHQGPVNAIRFSPDGKWAISAGDDGVVKLWDIAQGKEITAFASQCGPVTWVQFHRSLLMLVTASVNGIFHIYDLENFVAVAKSPRPATGQLHWAMFHPESPVLYAASTDCIEICAYEPAPQELETVILAADWRGLIHDDVAFGPGDQKIISVGRQPDSGTVTTFMLDVQACAPFAQTARPLTQSSGRRSFNQPLNSDGRLEGGDNESGASHGANKDSVDPKEQRIVDDSEYQRFFGGQKPRGAPPAPQPPPQRQNNGRSMLDDFLPNGDRGQSGNSSSADELRHLRQPHDAFVVAMSSRFKNLQMMRSLWSRSGPKHAVETACNLGDPGVVVDLLHLLLDNQRLWSLDLAVTVLPQLVLIVQSKYTDHIKTACQTIRLILNNFGETIRSNISSPPDDPALNRVVDLNREERYRKCRACYKDLKAAGNALERISINRQVPINGAREVLMLMKLLD